jgi:serine/threonine protein kinase
MKVSYKTGGAAGGLEEREASQYFREIAQGVKYMQERNILHRDLKLSNVMITLDKRVKIIDFGLAIQLKDFVEEDTTICGTPNYISPETITGKRFGPQSDLWAIGCILYVMLVGSPPFESSSVK